MGKNTSISTIIFIHLTCFDLLNLSQRNICPSNNISVSLYSLGEGFHNYHHTFPWDYRAHDMTNISFTTEILNMLSKIGWAYEMRYPSRELIERVAKKYGDGTFINWGNHIPEEECEELEKSKAD